MPVHLDIAALAVVIEGVAPCLLSLSEGAHVILEEEDVLELAVPPSSGGKHVLFLPEIDRSLEHGEFRIGIVVEFVRPDEHGVGEHVHIVAEHEVVARVGVASFVALDDLSVLAAHGGAVMEQGKAVAGIVVELARTEDIPLGILQFHERAPEPCNVVVDIVHQAVAREDGIALGHHNISYTVDYVRITAPQRGIALKIGPVVEEHRIGDLADQVVSRLELLHIVRLLQPQQRIDLPGIFILGRKNRPDAAEQRQAKR